MSSYSRKLLTLALILMAGSSFAASEDEVVAQARAIHSRVITLDSHIDIPLNFSTSEHMPGEADAQVNLSNMEEGGLDAAFFIVYVGQSSRTPENYRIARADALTKFAAIHRMIELYPQRIGLATSKAEAEALAADGKLIALIGIENGYVIGKDLSLIEEYFDMGGRYMTLVHNGHNDIGDSAQPRPEFGDDETGNGGLSDFGYSVVEEMNRVGMLVDISHVSKDTMLQATQHSKVPVIASHSSIVGVAQHARNLDDEQLLALKENGGVVQVVAFEPYVKEGGGSTVQAFVDHIDYAVNLIGVQHVGISSDFGGGGGIEGWNSAEETFNVTLELVRRGYTEDEISAIWSGNVLRVLEQARVFAESQN